MSLREYFDKHGTVLGYRREKTAMDYHAELKLEIKDVERQIKEADDLGRDLRNKRQVLQNKLADIVCPFKVGDRIRFKLNRWGTDDLTREGIVVGIRGTWGEGYELAYNVILKNGKQSDTTRRLWNNSSIVERNGQPIEIARGY